MIPVELDSSHGRGDNINNNGQSQIENNPHMAVDLVITLMLHLVHLITMRDLHNRIRIRHPIMIVQRKYSI